MEKMKTAALFDVDGTLTPPRQPITESMVRIIDRLCVPFSVAAGSHLPLLKKQFFEPLFQYGYRKKFNAFLSNGAIQYLCDFSEGLSVLPVKSFNIREFLGESDYRFLIDTLEKTLDLSEFKLPGSLKVFDNTIVFRDSMVNFVPIGRLKVEGPEAQTNRNNFVAFDNKDRKNGYRLDVMAHLNRELAPLIEKKGLKITLGGQTSFDIGIVGKDKTNAVTTLFESGVERVVFFGDALFEGGNDYAIREFEKTWPADSPHKIETVHVHSYKDTIDQLRQFGFLFE
ncbi:MAG: hypothetical protein KJ737_24915 [Proteobacteria bacterium]|nr:hypothetical protein [Pseudomonadota bacterium]